MIFIWIPKTGGTTFSESETPHMEVFTERYREAKPHFYPSFSFGHACPRALLKNNIIWKSLWEQHIKVALVRNPYNRFLSLFNDFKRTGRIDYRLAPQQFMLAIMEMDPKPGLFNSYGLSQCAPQVDWLLPDVQIIKFEDYIKNATMHLNTGGDYSKELNPHTIELINSYYRADFTVLNYDHV